MPLPHSSSGYMSDLGRVSLKMENLSQGLTGPWDSKLVSFAVHLCSGANTITCPVLLLTHMHACLPACLACCRGLF